MATIGSIVVELQANTAQFHQEMGKAANSLGEVHRQSAASERAIASFAARGIGTVIPAAQGAEFAIHKLIDRALHAAGALRLLGAAGAIIGGSLLVAAGVQRLQDEIKNWLALGETISQTTERLKQEADEQDKFATRRKAAVVLLIGLEGQLAQARGEASAAALRAQGDEPGAAGATLEAQAAAIQLEKQQRDRNIIETIAAGERRNQALIASEALLSERRIKISEDYYATIKKLQEDATAKAIAQFQTETTALLDSLQKRTQLRKQLEDEATAAAQRQGLGDVFAPFQQQDQVRRDADSIAKGFALLLDKGAAFRDVFPEILRIDAEFQARGFSGFAAAVDRFQGDLSTLRISSKSIEDSFSGLSKRLGDDMPAAVRAAGAAMDPFIQRLQLMEIQSNRTAGAIAALANAISSGAGAATPEVTAPVDLGVNP